MLNAGGQVLQDLPKKTERIEWCDMTPLQKSIYNDALQRSRKTIFDVEKDGTETPDPPATNGRGKAPKKKTRANARTKDKMYLENSSNVLMDLRKAASHPMLFRRRYTDDMLTSIAKLLLKEPDFKKRGAVFDYVKEDMEVMTDAELQSFCATYKVWVSSRYRNSLLIDLATSLCGDSSKMRTVTCRRARSEYCSSCSTSTRRRVAGY